MSSVKTLVFERIRDVPSQAWDEIAAGESLVYSREFWETLENSNINDFRYHYLLFLDEGEKPLGIAGVYSITTDIAIFAPPALRRSISRLRRFFPNFLKFSILECGTPVTPANSPFVFISDAHPPSLFTALDKALQAIAQRDGQFLIVMRDFESEAWRHQANLKALGYSWLNGLPNTYLDISWTTPDDYIAAMRSHYRRKLLRYLSQSQEKNYRYEMRNNFAELAEILQQQWSVVHEQADEYQREVLTPAFYRELSERLGENSKVLLFYREERLIGHMLLMQDPKLLRFMFFGRHQAGQDGLWIYAGYALIETAIRLGIPRVEFGLTTYDLKQELGATISPIRMALRTTRSIFNPFVGTVYRLLNRPEDVTIRHVFRHQ